MLPETAKRLNDMRRAAEAIGRFLDGKQLADMRTDELLRAGVYYEFAIIGEALSQVRRTDPTVAETLTEYDRGSSAFATRSSTGMPDSTTRSPGGL